MSRVWDMGSSDRPPTLDRTDTYFNSTLLIKRNTSICQTYYWN